MDTYRVVVMEKPDNQESVRREFQITISKSSDETTDLNELSPKDLESDHTVIFDHIKHLHTLLIAALALIGFIMNTKYNTKLEGWPIIPLVFIGCGFLFSAALALLLRDRFQKYFKLIPPRLGFGPIAKNALLCAHTCAAVIFLVIGLRLIFLVN